MSKQIYISCPMNVPESVLFSVQSLVCKLGGDPSHWIRGTKYNTQLIDAADAIVVILPGLSWALKKLSISSGTFSEINLAERSNKPIFLAYRTQNSILCIYSTKLTSSSIEGIVGTARNFEVYVSGKENLPFHTVPFQGEYGRVQMSARGVGKLLEYKLMGEMVFEEMRRKFEIRKEDFERRIRRPDYEDEFDRRLLLLL